MLLVFPTAAGIPLQDNAKVSYVRALDKDKFRRMLARKLKAGWVVHEMNSKFWETNFGGSVSYYAELRRSGGRKKEQLFSLEDAIGS